MIVEDNWERFLREAYPGFDWSTEMAQTVLLQMKKAFYGGFTCGLCETKKAYESPNIMDSLSSMVVETLNFAHNQKA